MILDHEDQRKFLLNMFNGVNFPGSVLDEAYLLKKAIERATIRTNLRSVPGEFESEGAHESAVYQPNADSPA